MGNSFLCRLKKQEHRWFGVILEKFQGKGESPLKITLAQSLIKKERFEWILEKATELGVSKIVPILSQHSIIRWNPDRQERKLFRWKKILVEAMKQCGRSHLPELHRPIPVSDLLSQKRTSSILIRLDEVSGLSLKKIISQSNANASWLLLVGPEGGWDEQDRAIMDTHNVQPIFLGSRILRSETAPLAAIAVLQHELGDISCQIESTR